MVAERVHAEWQQTIQLDSQAVKHVLVSPAAATALRLCGLREVGQGMGCLSAHAWVIPSLAFAAAADHSACEQPEGSLP